MLLLYEHKARNSFFCSRRNRCIPGCFLDMEDREALEKIFPRQKGEGFGRCYRRAGERYLQIKICQRKSRRRNFGGKSEIAKKHPWPRDGTLQSISGPRQ